MYFADSEEEPSLTLELAANKMSNPQEWFNSLTPITKWWLVAAVVSGLGARLGLLNPWLLAWDWTAITHKFQIWRLVTPFAFFGMPSFPWLIQLFMLSRFIPAYERDPFPSGSGAHMGNQADTVFMLAFGGAVLLLAGAAWLGMPFLAGALFMMVLYVWSKRHPETPTSFYMFQVPAAYLPWVMVGFSFIVGQDPIPDLLGIGVGHLYFFVKQVLPDMEGPFKDRLLLRTPDFLYRLFNLRATHANAAAVRLAERRAGGPAPAGGHAWGTGNVLGRG